MLVIIHFDKHIKQECFSRIAYINGINKYYHALVILRIEGEGEIFGTWALS